MTIDFLLTLLGVVIVFAVIFWAIEKIGLDPMPRKIAIAVAAVILILVMIGLLRGMTGFQLLR